MTDPWKLEALAQVEAVANSTPLNDAQRTLMSIGHLVHHVLGHSEDDWSFHLDHCEVCQWTHSRVQPTGRGDSDGL